MRRKTSSLLFVLVFLLPVIAGAVSEKDFKVETTENLINLCTTTVDDPLHNHAINFCHGYLAGAYHFYEAISSGPQGIQLVCLSDPLPSRNDTIVMFIEWVKTHPQHLGEKPVETQFRFLMEKWPCKP
jgi:hypothetical protein